MMVNKFRIKGFTLIELMVVASIISLLSSVTLVSVNSARVKAKNSRIVQEVNQLRNQLEIGYNGSYYSNFTSYAPPGFGSNVAAVSMFSGTTVSIINDILAQNGGQYGGGVAGTNVDATCGTSDYYKVSSGDATGWATNGLTIFVYPSCDHVTSYAIYAMLSPIKVAYEPLINTAQAAISVGDSDPTHYSGYFCVDSTNHSTTTSIGYIGYFSGGTVSDGLCH